MAKAFAAAAHAAFTLVVDCPVRIHTGLDISRTIFIDDGTSVEFTETGKFTVDNTLFPAFVIANSSNITLTDWNVEYDASVPVNRIVGGYSEAYHYTPGIQPAGAFNDYGITQWLAKHRGITFDVREGYVTSLWSGNTNVCAVFFISGDSSQVTVTGLRIGVPAAAGGDRFIPVVFSLNPNFKSNQTVTAKTPITAEFVAVPHDLTFSNVSFDGTYMGWVGSTHDTVLENIQSRRYGDLQDSQGNNVGGIEKWFMPPHLVYFAHYADSTDPALLNRNIQIKDVVDEGVRIGRARDTAGEVRSGNALSLKIGCNDCSVDNYKTARPDGFLDVLSSDGLTISNVVASYNSSFVNNLYPGWRFPLAPYSNLTFENISLTDEAPSTAYPPIYSATDPSNHNIEISNVHVTLNRWVGTGSRLLPTIAGQSNQISLNYSITADSSGMMLAQSGTVETTLQATPTASTTGAVVDLGWSSLGANNCAGSGAWTGGLPMNGTRTSKITTPGDYDFTLECRNAGSASSATMQIVVGK